LGGLFRAGCEVFAGNLLGLAVLNKSEFVAPYPTGRARAADVVPDILNAFIGLHTVRK
jgi:hypothetical protein